MTPAQDLAAQGFSVFPVVEDGKRPAIKQWPAKATADAERIRRWWARKPYNVGVYTGHRLHNGTRRHLVVLDLDNKNGADGVAELARLAARHGGLPATFTTETPTKGRHVWFHTSRPIGTNAGSLAPGVDIRAKRQVSAHQTPSILRTKSVWSAHQRRSVCATAPACARPLVMRPRGVHRKTWRKRHPSSQHRSL